MNPIQPLMSLLAQTERERDDAQMVHQRAQAALQAAQAQAEQLLQYRRDYEQRWSAQFSRQGPMELVHCYHSFTERLTQAVDHQAGVVAQAQSREAQCREKWLEQETRVAAVRKLIERRVHEQQLSLERMEQKATDEFASRSSWGRTSGLGATLGAAKPA